VRKQINKPQGKNLKLTDITFRQYMALTLIFSKLDIEGKYPTKEELKKIIGMNTDRMLQITLKALEKKGLIRFNGLENEPVVYIPEENKALFPILTDRLMLVKDFISYKEIKNLQKATDTPNSSLKLGVQARFEFSTNNLRELNDTKMVVHRWYSYLEDFPPSLVWDKLDRYGIKSGKVVLDPFVGSGTAVVTSKLAGVNAIGIDVNPVASYVTQVKTEWTRSNRWNIDLNELQKEFSIVWDDFLSASKYLQRYRLKTDFTEKMPPMELNQWLKTKTQNEVAFLRERIGEVENDYIKRILMVALLGAAVESSNVAFCPGTSFYPFRKRPSFSEIFSNKLAAIYEDLLLLYQAKASYGDITVFNEDSREIREYIDAPVDFIFTSPPYPNDLEYTRQTRLELFLLGYVKSMEDVREIKKKMVKGSTKLIFKESNSAQYVEKFESVQKVANAVEEALSDRKWGWDYPRMIREYFGDMYLSLESFKEVLKPGSYALLVVGDQTYKQIVVPVGQILVEIASDLRYEAASLELLRIRRSTTHKIPLREEIVILKR
jgi:DNA modification methylase